MGCQATKPVKKLTKHSNAQTLTYKANKPIRATLNQVRHLFIFLTDCLSTGISISKTDHNLIAFIKHSKNANHGKYKVLTKLKCI